MNSPIFTPEMKTADLVQQNYRLLFVLNRVGIPLGFGEKTVKQVCAERSVDTTTFLALCRLHTSPENIEKHDWDCLSAEMIVNYLRNSHVYFLKQRLPDICAKLNVALAKSASHELILRFFEEYENEVAEHMDYENDVFFPYVLQLLKGEKAPDYSADDYRKRHNDIEEKLADLSNLLLKYLPDDADNYLISNVLIDLNACDEDLKTHTFIEDEVLLPKIIKMEKDFSHKTDNDDFEDENKDLSDREKEILVSIVKGLLNKEIADRHNISINTVITHRRNISRKLGIRGPAGLTVYAILNKLVNINELQLDRV
ncbi:MAG: helix-turn-helix transcriptional regulator [Prevotellaceae bacterium]|jgi:regulator of cell morphogenesis and NO signaling|nr:helix-turn-helix transcriptional regulator [Prevotellaceae bacterium]